jgi:hypothetical protein
MREAFIFDTNVPMAANEREGKAPSVRARCVSLIRQCRDGFLILDNKWIVLNEYSRNLHKSGQGLGDAFLRFVLNTRGDPRYCLLIPITPHESRIFVEFPDDPRLEDFDRNDRKWIALAVSSGNIAPVYAAADYDDYRPYLGTFLEHGVRVELIEP